MAVDRKPRRKTQARNVVMIAAENDALVGGKVGGVGDVIRDLARGVAELGWNVTVIVPSYGFLHSANPSKLHSRVLFPFRGGHRSADVYQVESRKRDARIIHYVIEHADVRGEPIYFDDPAGSPFQRDASKYALFCSAAGQLLKTLGTPAVLHLHDWHAATLLMLREKHPYFGHLKGARTAYTIHNLALQGTRPMAGDLSSLEAWFPELFIDRSWVPEWMDDRYADPCFTPMAAAIRLADRVNTVSPTYAGEILLPSDPARGYYGGEGLDPLLNKAKAEGRLFGILNGCEYPEARAVRKPGAPSLLASIRSKLADHDDLVRRLDRFQKNPPGLVLTSVTRVVDQKVRLLCEPDSSGRTGIEALLSMMDSHNGVFIMLGRGTADYEYRMWEAFGSSERFLFIHGYHDDIGTSLYAGGDLFIMPSLFEPCGIGQMLAMRDRQPCLVHAVGGLRDTVTDGVNGFTFAGDTLRAKVDGFGKALGRALALRTGNAPGWESVCEAASNARFPWGASAQKYVELMYGG